MLIQISIDVASLLADKLEEYGETTQESPAPLYARKAVISNIRLAEKLGAKSVSLDSRELTEVAFHKILGDEKLPVKDEGVKVNVRYDHGPVESSELTQEKLNRAFVEQLGKQAIVQLNKEVAVAEGLLTETGETNGETKEAEEPVKKQRGRPKKLL